MAIRLSSIYRWPALAVLATGASLWIVGLGLGNADTLVARGFAAALETGSGGVMSPPAGDPGAALAQLSGSEEFWLDNATLPEGSQPASWAKPVTLGDRITISSGGRFRVLDVVEIQAVSGGMDTNGMFGGNTKVAGSERLLLVTCRDPQAPDAHPVRFVIEGDQLPDDQRVARTPRTL
ncbi:MAG: hypothetical protein CTY20_13765 [Hyphomicrobium sp.]|nr:MAG: hypothetical protein CTY20_13765 [Hyphomicrobium sp.]